MKRIALIVALALVLTFVFAASAFATSGKFWNYNEPYYSWGSYSGSGIVPGSVITTPGGTFTATGTFAASNFLYNTGANAANPGVHANYLANTAKCGICHSVHRATATGIKLLNASVSTCAGCHVANSTVTNVEISWQSGGPHSSGAACTDRACHVNNPHGANGSKWKLFASKLITVAADAAVQPALDNSAASGITTAELDGSASTWSQGIKDAVITGYTCNFAGCHGQSQFTVLSKGWAQEHEKIYPDETVEVLRTGHMTSAAATSTHASYTAVDSCTSCHDQTDSGTRSGFTFPHSQTPYGTSNLGAGRAYLWMGFAGAKGDALTAVGSAQKAYDGTCLKCHRDTGGTAGIGITQ